MRHALVFGGSGQIGRALVARLARDNWRVSALSRGAQPSDANVIWLRGDFAHAGALPTRCDAVFSCGPLDHFARWYAQAAIDCPRVIAFGSTSVDVKRDSADAGERDLSRRLAIAERTVLDIAARNGAHATLLRPTLVYGAAADRTLTRIAAIAARWHRFALPRDAIGLRQPVHVDDLAQAACDVVDADATRGRAYAVPGGEALPYRDLIARILQTLQPPATLHVLPSPVFASLLALARASGAIRDFGPAAVARMREDLTFDLAPARRDFGYAPRAFAPTADMFSAR